MIMNYDKDLKSIQEARVLAAKGKEAATKIAEFNEEQIEKIIKNMVRVAKNNEFYLAELAVKETGFGKIEDKKFKNHLASTILYDSIKDMKTIDVIEEDSKNKTITIAEPVGLVLGITPSTNPTSTTIFKSIISIKSRNAIVFSPHPSALECTLKTVDLMNRAAIEAGAPANIVTCVETCTIQATDTLMKSKEVAVILATGGPGMVKAAYSSGKPALGVGAGNSPAYIEKTADIEKAVKNIIASKTFDNGTICASEQTIICERSNKDAVVKEFKKNGAYFMSQEETQKVCKILFRNGHNMNPKFVGRSAKVIADAANIVVPEDVKVLIGEQEGVGPDYPLSYEKLTTVLGFYVVENCEEACELSMKLLQNGIGHTMSVHTEDFEVVKKFSKKPASRILINTGGSQGGTGASTGLLPSFTLGCGTSGGSSISENLSPLHLINTKKVAFGLMDCFTETVETTPKAIYNTIEDTKKQEIPNLKDLDNVSNEELMELMNKIMGSLKG